MREVEIERAGRDGRTVSQPLDHEVEAHRIGFEGPELAEAVDSAGSGTKSWRTPQACAAAKTALNRGLDSRFLAELEATLEQQTACFATRDFAEGVEALAAKRPPRFTGA